MAVRYKFGLSVFLLFFCTILVQGQGRKLFGVVKDKQSDEPIPFASVVFRLSNKGVLTDSAGRFSLDYTSLLTNDSVSVISVGYKPLTIPVRSIKDTAELIFKIEVLPLTGEAVVKSKYNRALWFWRKIMANKDKNNRTRWDSYSYEIYNKLEMDLNNVKPDKLKKNIFLKPLGFILDYVDSADGSKPYLPVYLTETLSDYYYQKNPEKIHEIIKATKTNGLDNESLIKEFSERMVNKLDLTPCLLKVSGYFDIVFVK